MSGYWRFRKTGAHQEFRAARDLLLAHRLDHAAATAEFRWPRPAEFNWALEWFDVIAERNHRPALALLDGLGGVRETSFADLSARSDAVAVWLRGLGVRRGDRVLIVLGQQVELWECLLACMKLGAVVIPTYTSLTPAEALDRVRRGRVRHVVCWASLTHLFDQDGPGGRIAVGGAVAGWTDYRGSLGSHERFVPDGPTPSGDLAFAYFTSGTTSAPKLVAHNHVSYPVGHLTGMYWSGLLPGDRHLNVSAPGWAKHSWSSFFVPWNAEATVLAVAGSDIPVAELPRLLAEHGANSFCAPPSTWRAMRGHLGSAAPRLREATSAGEPLDATLAERVERAWGVAVRDGYGQTETTCLAGTCPGMRQRPGWLGLPMPGYLLTLRDPDTATPGESGEVCVELAGAPVGLAVGYLGREERPFDGTYYRTGDLGERDEHGYLRIAGRLDDVFKSAGHRVSPYELEAALRRHPAVAEAVVLPRPDPVAGLVPHAVVVAAEGVVPGEELASALLLHLSERIRSVRFVRCLPRTASGKVRRAELVNDHEQETGNA
ncbi:AMP-binding protein [Amycolatopsis minnesotensis]|uniref:Isobutyrate:CoA ligase IbuL n=1 Tax=Amycolatopsis minnesotensis TaxID=337894 RepID=A0ABN2RKJ7_9PSEU